MSKKGVAVLLFVMSAISLMIAIYQFAGGRPAGGIASVVFALAFLIGAIVNQRASRGISHR